VSESLPLVLVPGLLCSLRLYAPQLPALWARGPVTVADHTRDESMSAIAQRILAAAPPRFALAGLSMGGYVALEIVRQARERVARLALLDTTARPDTPEQTESRRQLMELAARGRLPQVADSLFERLVAPSRHDDAGLRELNRMMAEEVGAAAFARQQLAIMGRADARPSLGEIRCPTLVLVGDSDALTPPNRAAEIAAGIVGARLITVAGCGHLSTLERPLEVTQALLAWLQT
jgi:pimeloyl-ACP methyl ester carboxylesterase